MTFPLKKILVGLALVLLVADARADRIDVWDANSVNVQTVQLSKLADGGCSVLAYASYTKADGGVLMEGSAVTDVAGANRVTCLDILNVKAPVLFKTDKGL